jgi:hypothetical protein
VRRLVAILLAARPGQVRAYTFARELRLALLATALGIATTLAGVKAWWDGRLPSQVQIRTAQIERAATDYSVYRLAFAYEGSEGICHLVTYHGQSTFTVRC